MLRYAFTVEDVFQLQTGKIALVGRYADSNATLNPGSAIEIMRATTHIYSSRVQTVEITPPHFIVITIKSPNRREILLPSDKVYLIVEYDNPHRETI